MNAETTFFNLLAQIAGSRDEAKVYQATTELPQETGLYRLEYDDGRTPTLLLALERPTGYCPPVENEASQLLWIVLEGACLVYGDRIPPEMRDLYDHHIHSLQATAYVGSRLFWRVDGERLRPIIWSNDNLSHNWQAHLPQWAAKAEEFLLSLPGYVGNSPLDGVGAQYVITQGEFPYSAMGYIRATSIKDAVRRAKRSGNFLNLRGPVIVCLADALLGVASLTYLHAFTSMTRSKADMERAEQLISHIEGTFDIVNFDLGPS